MSAFALRMYRKMPGLLNIHNLTFIKMFGRLGNIETAQGELEES